MLKVFAEKGDLEIMIKTVSVKKLPFLRYKLRVGIAFGVLCALFIGSFSLPHSDRDRILISMMLGLFSSFATASFYKSSRIQKQTNNTLPSEENAILCGTARYCADAEERNGKLYLTSTHLVFQPHIANEKRTPFELPLTDITKVSNYLMFGILPNELLVETVKGNNWFLIKNAAKWRSEIIKQQSLA